MGKVRWTGNALPVAQVTEYVLGGTWEATDIITFTINGKDVAVVVGSVTITDIIDTLVTAWNDLDPTVYPEFDEITASNDGVDTFILTADTEGKPFTCTLSTTDAGGAADAQTIDGGTTNEAGTDTTACSGPNFWDVAENWDTGAVPVNSDDVYIENSDISILYGLTNTSLALTSLRIAASYTGQIGLPDKNDKYVEYRTKRLAFSQVTTLLIGYGPGQGSQFINLHTGTAGGCAATVFNTGSAGSGAQWALQLTGSHSSNSYEFLKGSIGVATADPNDTAQGVVKIGYVTNPDSDVTVTFSEGFTFGANPIMSGGQVETNTAIGTFTQSGGVLTHRAGACTLLNLWKGTCFYNSSGTLTDANIGPEGKLDFSQDRTAKTVTNAILMVKGSQVLDPDNVVSTLKFKTVQCELPDVTVKGGFNKTYTLS